MPGLLTH